MLTFSGKQQTFSGKQQTDNTKKQKMRGMKFVLGYLSLVLFIAFDNNYVPSDKQLFNKHVVKSRSEVTGTLKMLLLNTVDPVIQDGTGKVA